ncbi:MAG: DUF885 family protein [Gammaproteobacteria bacterium]|nr:DUF885 family protein [Gammaproteobacteria bacterium]
MDSASDAFHALVEEFYGVWFRFHPDALLSAALPGYGGSMPALDDSQMGALGSWLESTVVGLEEIDFDALDPAEQIDMELLFGACRDEYQAILAHDWRHRDPLAFMPLRTIYQLALAIGNSGPAALEACLQGVPEILQQAREHLTGYPELIPRIWVDAALQQGAAGVRFLRQLSDRGGVGSGLQAVSDQASQAIAAYLEFLAREVASAAEGRCACGGQRFREQLRLRHHLPDRPDDYLDFARESYQKSRAELGMLSLEQTGSADPRGWMEKLNRKNPVPAEQRVQYVRRRSTEIYRMLAASGQFTLPQSAGLELQSMPDAYPLQAPVYRPPAPGVAGPSALLCLPGMPAAMPADTGERLTAWCIRNAWPGRHLQAAAAAGSPLAGTLVRRVNLSAAHQAGWSLYAEQLTQELGFFPTPEQALQGQLERLRRSLMAVLDIEFHVHGMAASGALLQLRSLPGHSAEQAAHDLLSLTRRPTQHLAAVVEWKILDALRRWHARSGGIDMAAFHTRLLAQGGIATPPVIARFFGRQAWAWVEAQVYSQ